MMGATQKDWFKNELLTDEPVKCWVQDSGWLKPFPPDDHAQSNDKWSDYPDEHEELGDYIATTAVGQVFSIHGDTHMLAADDGSYNRWGGFPTYCAAPLGNTTTYEPGPWSEGSWPLEGYENTLEHQYGLLNIADDGATITVTYTGYGTANGFPVAARVSHSLSVSTV
jgi:PhoD-like phosphatase